jgi:acyl-CoA oxidase
MKFWIGGSAQTVNMSVIWAQVTVNGVTYGPQPFIVQIRDLKTHDLMPGIIIGDCGDKMGLNGIDNGYFILEDVIVPK